MLRRCLPYLVTLLFLFKTMPSTTASETALPTVRLADILNAARTQAPGAIAASEAYEAAVAQRALTRAKNSISLNETGSYYHGGAIPGLTAAASGKTGVLGENVQAGLSLSGPLTSLSLSATQGLEWGASPSYPFSLSLSASQTVFDGYPGGRFKAALSQAECALKIAMINRATSLRALSFQATQGYYLLLGAQFTLSAREANLDQAAQELSQVQALKSAKKASDLDLAQAEISLEQAKADLESAQADMINARAALSILIGWDPGKAYTVSGLELPEFPRVNPDEALRSALEKRPETQTLKLQIESAKISLALELSKKYPTVSLTAGSALSISSTATGSFNLGASALFPSIYDAGAYQASVRQAKNVLAMYQTQLSLQEINIAAEIDKDLLAAQNSKKALLVAERTLSLAQRLYDFERQKRAAGLSTALNILTAQTNLANARAKREQARGAAILAILALRDAIGDWEAEQ
jgi:outer membrane protein TolC